MFREFGRRNSLSRVALTIRPSAGQQRYRPMSASGRLILTGDRQLVAARRPSTSFGASQTGKRSVVATAIYLGTATHAAAECLISSQRCWPVLPTPGWDRRYKARSGPRYHKFRISQQRCQFERVLPPRRLPRRPIALFPSSQGSRIWAPTLGVRGRRDSVHFAAALVGSSAAFT
jgi:hypothetical protein